MPGLSGYDLCQRIKEDPARRHLPVLLLTSRDDAEDITRGLECGADNFVTKPFRADYLVDRVRALLANRNLRTESRLRLGAEVFFLGRRLTVTADREQILGLLLSTFEDIVR